MTGFKMIGLCNCPITANCPITLSDYNFADQLVQNTAVNAPITFQEIVMVIIIIIIIIMIIIIINIIIIISVDW